jgi:tetratricopeptide (TPR) repeat protein
MLKEKWASFFTAILYAVHPIHTEAVSIIAHRQELLAMLFMLLGLIFYINPAPISMGNMKFNNNTKVGQYIPENRGGVKQKSTKNYLPLIISCIFFALSLGAKEVAFVFPLLLLVYDIYFDREKLKLKHYIPYLIILGVFLLLFSIPSPRWNFKISGFDTVSFGHALSGNRTYASILLTQLKGFALYLKLLIFPHPLNIDYYFPIYNSIFQDGLLFYLILFLAIIFLTILTYKRYRIISFGIAWFLINLLPVLNILPKTYFVAERYLYIPSFGFCLIVGWLFYKGILKKQTKILSIVIFILITVLYSYKTIQRNFDFKSESTLWTAALKYNPKSVHGHHNLGVGLFESGKAEQAINEFKQAIELAPTFAKSYYNLGLAYFALNDNEKAIENLEKSILLDPKPGESYAALASIYQKTELFDLAILNYKSAIYNYGLTQDASLHYSLGTAYRDAGKSDEAIDEFKKASTLNPKLGEAHNDLGIEYGKKGLYDDAIKEFESALLVLKEPTQTYYNLALAYIQKQDYPNAVKSLQNCLKYWQGDKTAIQNMIIDLQGKDAKTKTTAP